MAAPAITLGELRTGPPTVDVRTACRALGISRSHGYNLIAAGEFPAKVIAVGSRRRVITVSLLRLLEGDDGRPPASTWGMPGRAGG
jgi:predicted DNA-binding transcriptional regulator AlpA